RRLEIVELRIGELRATVLPVEASGPAEPLSPPDDLTLPLAVSARRVAIDSLYWNGEALATGLAVRLASDGRQHAVEEFALRAGEVSASGKITLDGQAPFPLKARAEAHAQLGGWLAERPLAVVVDVGGTLARIGLSARAPGLDGEARATLAPFAAWPLSAAEVRLRDIDPSAWLPGAPPAKLDVEAEFRMEGERGETPTARLRVTNRLPGPLDRQRIPFASAVVRAVPDGGAARLEEVVLELPGDGVLRGDGRWSEATLTLALGARRFDAARLVSRLFPTRFDGPLAVSLGAERQSARLAWRDERIQLTAEAEHAGEVLTVKTLELAANDARLSASGRIETGGGRAFAAKGVLRRFDPSRFAHMPAARIDADIEARGRLGAQPVVDGRFALNDSRYAGMPLSGQGRVSLAWPRIHDVDIALAAGPNQISAAGAFGQPGDRLNVRVDAPRLTPFGLDGALRGRLDLAGTIERPALTLDLAAPRLDVPELGTFSELTLRGELGSESDSPLDVELALARFTRHGEDEPMRESTRESVRALKARVSGSQRAHRLEADGRFAVSGAKEQEWRWRIAAAGGFGENWRWLGQLRELRLAENDERPRLSLVQPAALEIAAAGWSVGPLALAGKAPEWTAELRANADADRLQAEATVIGAPSGRIEGQLEAGMRGPWQIAEDAPWRGRLNLDVGDLAWLGGLLGEGWQSGGKLAGALTVGGRPARPELSGRLGGSELALRLPEQGLRLTDGQLAAEFDGGILRVTRLGFASALDEPPRALRQALGDAAQRFATPGRVDVSGELDLGDGATEENAYLDIRLDRFGVSQSSDQWIAVSGGGRVSWRGESLSARGELGVDAGYWQLAPAGMPRLSDDVLVKRPEAPANVGARPNLDLDLKVALGHRFLFRGAGLQTWLAGDVRLTARGRDLPRASGTIRLRDGRFDAYGQQLDIERGFLTFQDLLNDPALDVRAVRKGLAVEAGVQIGGSARRPVVRLISDPDLPDTDKLAWLLLGHGPESMGAGDAALLVSAAGELLGNDSGGIVQQLKNTFGIDELGIRQGGIGGAAARGPASRIAATRGGDTAGTANGHVLSVGKRLSADATLAYEQSLTQAESVVKLTVKLTRNIAVIGRAGSDNALDILYTLTFGQPPRRDSGADSLLDPEADPGSRDNPARE
ncbi:MAG: translocation/assembly module TamB domain-containing protein, partial [Candidatus Accumulibacter sp.]|nr:translocation/assembly module TamB domain-containing protein [Accumulibacter sp.]